MAIKEIPLEPQFAAESLEVDLEDTVYEMFVYWVDRLEAWFLNTYQVRENGTREKLSLGFRLRAGSVPVSTGARNEFAGVLIVIGKEHYSREDLGDDLRLLYITSDDALLEGDE